MPSETTNKKNNTVSHTQSLKNTFQPLQEENKTPASEKPSSLINKKDGHKKKSVAKKTTSSKQKSTTSSKTASKKGAAKEIIIAAEKTTSHQPPLKVKKICFFIRYHTTPGQSLYLLGNHPILGNNQLSAAIPMEYVNSETWKWEWTVPDSFFLYNEEITYNYILKNEDGSFSYDWGNDKKIVFSQYFKEEVIIIDAWNFAGFYENAFYTEPFTKVLLPLHKGNKKVTISPKTTHTFFIKAPLLPKDYSLAICGNISVLGNWNTQKALPLNYIETTQEWSLSVSLMESEFPVFYKYGIVNAQGQWVQYEDGANRILSFQAQLHQQVVMRDGFAVLPNNTWHGAGINIPVFSLRSENSFGVGEFSDLKLLVDWAKKVGLKLIQILPVNDTTATHTWKDSYPYSAISAFALHPLYINLFQVAGKQLKTLLERYEEKRKQLNSLAGVDYESVTALKWEALKEIYSVQKKKTFKLKSYAAFFEQNKHWLIPYAAFSFLRDTYGTCNADEWPSYKTYQPSEIEHLVQQPEHQHAIGFYYFIQYYLHEQLQDAVKYAHQNGIVLKGDIPIGIYRHGVDAWQNKPLFHMQYQAGAPPDNFAVKGQNWGFPIYNWEQMQSDGYAWWKQRFKQMSHYFDAFRIDHILGFFRIWAIPTHAVEGIMGHFIPAIPISIHEFKDRHIAFDYNRFCSPFITDEILTKLFNKEAEWVKQIFLNYDGWNRYYFKPEFSTQKQIEKYFSTLEKNEHHSWLLQNLYNLIANVIFFEEENSNGTQFHFRFNVDATLSFQYLDVETQSKLKALYIDYFFRRQDAFWKQAAMLKLPALKKATNMLICGEDLGLIPACVPEVMKQLGLLSLEVQRMPKQSNEAFLNLRQAPYLSVVTPSTHDMSTIRGWWEEDRAKTQLFYNTVLGYEGSAPLFCEPWICKAIMMQHLQSSAMWSIFLLQDLLSISAELRKENPHDERINHPEVAQFYWRYRMHLSLEQLLNAESFNNEIKAALAETNRL